MSERQVDNAVKARFEGLRADVAQSGRVPEFKAVLELAAARPTLQVVDGGLNGSRRVLRAGAWASVAVAAAVAGVLLIERGPSEDEEFARLVSSYSADVSAGGWRSPTSGLLEVPGIELMRSLPSFGSSIGGLELGAEPEPPTGRGGSDGV